MAKVLKDKTQILSKGLILKFVFYLLSNRRCVRRQDVLEIVLTIIQFRNSNRS